MNGIAAAAELDRVSDQVRQHLEDAVAVVDIFQLAPLTPSPVVELNRAVAVAMALGPQAGLDIVDALKEEPALANYHLLPSVRADLLMKVGRLDEAR
jgi:predicted RNA polymerase sigma factor